MTKLFRFIFKKMSDRAISASLLFVVLTIFSTFQYGIKYFAWILIFTISVSIFISFIFYPLEHLMGEIRERYFKDE